MKRLYTKNRFNVLHMIASGGLYGAESVILNLSTELERCGIVSAVGVIHENRREQTKLIEVAKQLGLATAEFPQKNKFDLTPIIQFREFVLKNNIHLIHSHGYKATAMCFIPSILMEKKMMVTCHLWSNENDLKLKAYHTLEACLMRFLPLTVGVSEKICQDISKMGVRKDRIETIYNGINLNNYPQHSKTATQYFLHQVGIDPDDYLIGTIGRLDTQKAQHYLIDAFSQLSKVHSNVKCIILGDGKLKATLRAQCRQLGLEGKLFIVGFRNDIINILERLDTFVLTSVDEGLPMVLLEAMATQKAIITTPVGQIEEIIKNEINGMICPVGDVEALAHTLLQLYNAQELRNKLAENAFNTFKESYTSQKMTMHYIQAYERLLSA